MAFLPTYDSLPQVANVGGIRTSYGTLLPPGANVYYLRSTGATNLDPPEIADRLNTTLAAALLKCRANAGDVIYVLPGHSESVTTTPTFVAGVRIMGIGHGGNKPVFRWTATSSQWAINVADVVIQNLRLRMEGAVVVKAIAITGSDVVIDNCECESASGTSNYAAIGIEIGTGAARCQLSNLRVRGVTATAASNFIKITGTAQNGIRITGCDIIAPGHATTGLIEVNNACTDLLIADCRLYNTVASSTCTICLDDFASDGFIVGVDSMCKNNGTATAQGITFGSSTLIAASRTYEVDEVKKNSILSPGVGT
jgi:hypothetical protein